MSPQAGKRNRYVTIQRRKTTRDELGEPLPASDPNSWEKVTSVWASIAHLSGLQTIKSDAEQSIVRASIRISYRTDIASGMRVVYGGAIYMIRALLPDAATHEHLDLVCDTGAAP